MGVSRPRKIHNPDSRGRHTYSGLCSSIANANELVLDVREGLASYYGPGIDGGYDPPAAFASICGPW